MDTKLVGKTVTNWSVSNRDKFTIDFSDGTKLCVDAILIPKVCPVGAGIGTYSLTVPEANLDISVSYNKRVTEPLV